MDLNSLITVVVPVKNEEKNLPQCLKALSGLNHVVVVDSGSSDRTEAIAREFGAEFLHFQWDGHFPKKRNWTLRNHPFKTPWVLFLDADEYVSPQFLEEIERVLPTTKHTGFWLTYHDYFQRRHLAHGVPFRKLALFRVGHGEYEKIEEDRWSILDMEIHEHPVIEGSTGIIEGPINHRDFRGFSHYVKKHTDYAIWEAARYWRLRESGSYEASHLSKRQRIKYRYIVAWWFAPMYFFVSYFMKLGFLDGRPGLNFSICKFFYFFQIRQLILEKHPTKPR